jgi:tRNA-splicing ligase RtcB
MSRHAARRRITPTRLRRELAAHGVVVRGGSGRGLTEEAPFAYKDIDAVVETVGKAGLARRVARLAPIGVLKG